MTKRFPEVPLVPKPNSDEGRSAIGFKWAGAEVGTRHKLGGNPTGCRVTTTHRAISAKPGCHFTASWIPPATRCAWLTAESSTFSSASTASLQSRSSSPAEALHLLAHPKLTQRCRRRSVSKDCRCSQCQDVESPPLLSDFVRALEPLEISTPLWEELNRCPACSQHRAVQVGGELDPRPDLAFKLPQRRPRETWRQSVSTSRGFPKSALGIGFLRCPFSATLDEITNTCAMKKGLVGCAMITTLKPPNKPLG